MTESPETTADLIRYAASRGYVVSAGQLARWHRAGLLPRPRQQSLGRGRGTATVYQRGTCAQLVALCKIRVGERRLDRAAFRLWWDGFAVDLAVIRRLLAAHARGLDEEVRPATNLMVGGPSGDVKHPGLGRAGAAALAAITASQVDPDAPPVAITWDAASSAPPNPEELGRLIDKVVAEQIRQTSSLEALVLDASDEDLALARHRARSLLTLMRNTLAPMAWLHGQQASVFEAIDRLLADLRPSEYVGLVTTMLIWAPSAAPDTLAGIDAGAEPALVTELRQIMAIKDQIPRRRGAQPESDQCPATGQRAGPLSS